MKKVSMCNLKSFHKGEEHKAKELKKFVQDLFNVVVIIEENQSGYLVVRLKEPSDYIVS